MAGDEKHARKQRPVEVWPRGAVPQRYEVQWCGERSGWWHERYCKTWLGAVLFAIFTPGPK